MSPEGEARADQAILFLSRIGIPTRRSGERFESFLPGVWLDQGYVVYNYEMLRNPSDLYHEAGHLAIIPSLFRTSIPRGHDFDGHTDEPWHQQIEDYLDTHMGIREDGSEDPVIRGVLQMGETEAIAWSYAAMLAAGEDTLRGFSDDPLAYNGEGPDIHLALSMGAYLGIHGLQAAGLTTVRTFPTMTRWTQT